MEAKGLSTPVPRPFELPIRIRHPSIDPGELSREFGIVAEHAFRAGDPRSSRQHAASQSVHTETYWLGTLKAPRLAIDISFPENTKSQLAQGHLTASTDILTWALFLGALGFFKLHEVLLRRLRAEGGEISLLVAISATEVNNFNLAPEAARVFGELGITIEFELAND